MTWIDISETMKVGQLHFSWILGENPSRQSNWREYFALLYLEIATPEPFETSRIRIAQNLGPFFENFEPSNCGIPENKRRNE